MLFSTLQFAEEITLSENESHADNLESLLSCCRSTLWCSWDYHSFSVLCAGLVLRKIRLTYSGNLKQKTFKTGIFYLFIFSSSQSKMFWTFCLVFLIMLFPLFSVWHLEFPEFVSLFGLFWWRFAVPLLPSVSQLCPFPVAPVSLVNLCTGSLVPSCGALEEKCCCWPLSADLSGFLLRRFGLINFPNWILSVCIPTLNHQQLLTFTVDVLCWHLIPKPLNLSW